jgi:hypothetical protein
MTTPKSIKAELLLNLIALPFITERHFSYNCFRMELHKLRVDLIPLGIDLKSRWIEFTGTYGRKGKYKEHYLLDEDKAKAGELYEKINKETCISQNK